MCSPGYVRAKARTYRAHTRRSPTGGFLPLSCSEAVLANSGPAALDQNHQNDHKQYSGNDPDHRCIVHVVPLSNVEILIKRLHHDDDRGTEATRKMEGKIKNTRGKTSFTVVFAAYSSIC